MNPVNANRLQIKLMVELSPGVHLRMLSRLAGISLNATHYHVCNMEKDGEIVCWKEGGYLRSFPPWVEDERDRRIYALLQKKAARRILHVLYRTEPQSVPMTNGAISDLTGLSRSSVSEYLALFRNLLIARRATGLDGRFAYELDESNKDHVLEILRSLDKNLMTKVTDRYLDLWEP